MKVAVFSDVHGNLIALERFVEATKNTVDTYLCLGDTVNYGPWNDECCEVVQQLPGITIIEGNHERMFLGSESINHEIPLVQEFYQHSRPLFSRSDLITDLPRSIPLAKFECVHTIDSKSVYPDTEIQITQHYLIGHTHHQFRIMRSGFEIVNPGSVGQNRKWIDMVDYAIVDTESEDIQLLSVRYEIDRFLAELRSRSYPNSCIRYYEDKPRQVQYPLGLVVAFDSTDGRATLESDKDNS